MLSDTSACGPAELRARLRAKHNELLPSLRGSSRVATMRPARANSESPMRNREHIAIVPCPLMSTPCPPRLAKFARDAKRSARLRLESQPRNANARRHCQVFFPWYNDERRHSGIEGLTPAQVHFGSAPRVLEQRQ